MLKFVKFLCFIFTSIIVLVAVAYFIIVDNLPTVTQSHILAPESAFHSKQALVRVYQQLNTSEQQKHLVLTQQELTSLSALVHRAFPAIASEVTISPRGAFTALSYQLPKQRGFINTTLRILPCADKLCVGQLTIGSARLSGEWLINLVAMSVNYFIQQKLGDKLLNIIKGVEFSQNTMKAKLEFDSSLADESKQSALLTFMRDYLGFSQQSILANNYYHFLADAALQHEKGTSLANLINTLFAKVHENIQQLSQQEAVAHNKAATIALVNYLGDNRFQLFFGKVQPITKLESMKRVILASSVTLNQRVDLQKHFVYSMALQLLSNEQASDAIGEFKEFLDTNKGGSGFSFADLLADRAGTRLAMMLSDNELDAWQLANTLAVINEPQLLPTIEGLEEGIKQAQFSQRYKSIQSDAYKQAIQQVDQRLKALSLYQASF